MRIKLFAGWLILLVFFAGCSNGGNNSEGELMMTSEGPIVIYDSVENDVCRVVATCRGISHDTLVSAANFFGNIAKDMQRRLGSCDKVMVVLDIKFASGFYDGEIHLSPELGNNNSILYMRIIHEYTHHIHMTYKIDPDWLLEVLAETMEYLYGYEAREYHIKENPAEEPPAREGPIKENMIRKDMTKGDLFVVDYTTQRHFGVFLVERYGEDILGKIIHSGYTGKEAVVKATDDPNDTWDSIYAEWQKWMAENNFS